MKQLTHFKKKLKSRRKKLKRKYKAPKKDNQVKYSIIILKRNSQRKNKL